MRIRDDRTPAALRKEQGLDMIRPYGDRILVEKIDGHGVETVSPGGIVLPAVEWKRGKTKHVPDTFRARVRACGSKVAEVLGQELREGDEVVIYTYAEDGHGRVLVGDDTPYGLFVRARDVIAIDDLAFLRNEPAEAYEVPLNRGSWARFVI